MFGDSWVPMRAWRVGRVHFAVAPLAAGRRYGSHRPISTGARPAMLERDRTLCRTRCHDLEATSEWPEQPQPPLATAIAAGRWKQAGLEILRNERDPALQRSARPRRTSATALDAARYAVAGLALALWRHMLPGTGPANAPRPAWFRGGRPDHRGSCASHTSPTPRRSLASRIAAASRRETSTESRSTSANAPATRAAMDDEQCPSAGGAVVLQARSRAAPG